MKTSFFAAAALLITAPVSAADLPMRTLAPAPEPLFSPTPVASWAGFYAGVQVGYARGDTERLMYSAGALSDAGDLAAKGVLGGVHAGYNLRRGPLVLGAELDFEAAGVGGDRNDMDVANRLRGSARLRAGYVVDNALLYVTGGVAQARWRRAPIGRDSLIIGKDSALGWTVGAGVDYALSSNWSARLEYRYSDFGGTEFAIPAAFFVVGQAASTLKASATEHAIRIGASYRFGDGAVGPIVARY